MNIRNILLVMSALLLLPSGAQATDNITGKDVTDVCMKVRDQLMTKKIDGQYACSRMSKKMEPATNQIATEVQCKAGENMDRVYIYEGKDDKKGAMRSHKVCVVVVRRKGKTIKKTVYRSTGTMEVRKIMSHDMRETKITGANGDVLAIVDRNGKRLLESLNGVDLPGTLSPTEVNYFREGGNINLIINSRGSRFPASYGSR